MTQILNVHAPNAGASEDLKQKLVELQEEKYKSTIIVRDFTIFLLTI